MAWVRGASVDQSRCYGLFDEADGAISSLTQTTARALSRMLFLLWICLGAVFAAIDSRGIENSFSVGQRRRIWASMRRHAFGRPFSSDFVPAGVHEGYHS